MKEPREEWPDNDTAMILLLGLLAVLMILFAVAMNEASAQGC